MGQSYCIWFFVDLKWLQKAYHIEGLDILHLEFIFSKVKSGCDLEKIGKKRSNYQFPTWKKCRCIVLYYLHAFFICPQRPAPKKKQLHPQYILPSTCTFFVPEEVCFHISISTIFNIIILFLQWQNDKIFPSPPLWCKILEKEKR